MLSSLVNPPQTHFSPEGRCIPSGCLELSNRLTTVARRGSGPAFAAGHGDPYPDRYGRAFAFSTIPYPLIRQVALRLPCPFTEVIGRTMGLTTFL